MPGGAHADDPQGSNVTRCDVARPAGIYLVTFEVAGQATSQRVTLLP
jgi:hypothetical protein